MKKVLLSAFIGAIGLSAYAESVATTEFGYCTDETLWAADGISYGPGGNIGLAIRIPASAVSNYSGGKIIGLKVGAADQAYEHEIRAFLRKGTLTAENLTSATENISWEPINGGSQGTLSNVLFDSEWTIPADLDEDLYLGLYTTVDPGKRIIGISAYTQNVKPNTIYLADSTDPNVLSPDNWSDLSTVPGMTNSNPIIRCIIELPTENYQNVMMIDDAYAPNIMTIGANTKVNFFLRNDGPTPIQSFELTTTFGSQSVSRTINFEGDPMPSGYKAKTPQGIPVTAMGTGKHTITITKVNGEPNDASLESSSCSFDIVGVPAEEAAKHVRRPLYEFYCTETNHKSGVYEIDIVAPSLEPYKGRCTYLPHHTDDKFAQNNIDTPAYINGEQTFITLSDADRWCIKLSGDIMKAIMPSATIDRCIKMTALELGGKTMVEHPMAIQTPYPDAVIYFMNEALRTPTFASVEIESDYNPETAIVSINASGSIADVLPEGEKAKLSIFIIEETVKSDSQEFPDNDKIPVQFPDGIFTHNRVIRQTVTSFYGDELEPGQDFVKTYNVEIENPRWNTDHMKIVAVIQRPETNDLFHMDILNSNEEPMTASYVESGIETVEATRTADDTLYDLQGRRLSAPTRGINIINGKKILVR